jgi:gluconolactonase
MESFPESPTVGPDGELYVVDVAWGRIFNITNRGEVRVVLDYDGEPNGLAFASDGSAMIADYRRGLLSVSIDMGRWQPPRVHLRAMSGHSFQGLNDVLIVPVSGATFLTDQGDSGLHDPSGQVLRVGADGSATELLGGIPSPNALAYDDNSDCLYVAVTRDNAVWRIPHPTSGRANRAGRYLQLSGGIGPDGLCLGPGSSLFVTHLGLGAVYGFDCTGILRLVIDCRPHLEPTGVVCDGRRLIITEASASSVLTADIPDGLFA